MKPQIPTQSIGEKGATMDDARTEMERAYDELACRSKRLSILRDQLSETRLEIAEAITSMMDQCAHIEKLAEFCGSTQNGLRGKEADGEV